MFAESSARRYFLKLTGDGMVGTAVGTKVSLAGTQTQPPLPVVVRFPAGNYLCSSIHLKSNMICSRAIIVATDSPVERGTGYDPPEPNDWDKYQDSMRDVEVKNMKEDLQPGFLLEDVQGINLIHIRTADRQAAFVLKNVQSFSIHGRKPVPDAQLESNKCCESGLRSRVDGKEKR